MMVVGATISSSKRWVVETPPSRRERMYNAGIDIAALIDELPAGIDRAILRILSFHTGRGDAISRGKLVGDLSSMGLTLAINMITVVI